MLPLCPDILNETLGSGNNSVTYLLMADIQREYLFRYEEVALHIQICRYNSRQIRC